MECFAREAVLRGNFIALSTYIRKKRSSQINSLNSRLRKLEEEKQQTNASRRKEGRNQRRAEVSDTENNEDKLENQ